jgi:aspartate dehydrogenase
MLRIGLIGHGAIGKMVAEAILSSTHGLVASRITLVAVLVSTKRTETTIGCFNSLLNTNVECPITHDPSAFFQTDFDVCIECAGQSAVREHAVSCLQSGRKFLCTSIGALTDDSLFEACRQAAVEGNSTFALASGAMPAVDWMSSSALEPGSVVTATQTKPPNSWIGARYEPGTTTSLPDVINFAALSEKTTFFTGTAREAASFYPKNSNVLAMLALSTAGLDKTQVELVADPINTSMRQTIRYEGSAGAVTTNVVGRQCPSNPRTSQVVPLSVIKALRNMSSPVAIGL